MATFAVSSIAIGLATGLLSGMFGVGGAILSTPAVRLILGVEPIVAVGTTLPVVMPAAISAGAVYWKRGLFEKSVVPPLAAGGITGSLIGAFLTSLTTGNILLLITSIIILGSGFLFIHKALARRNSSSEHLKHSALPRGQGMMPLLAIGGAAGFVSGLLGIGGAIVLNPVLVFGLRMPVKKAFGTSLMLVAIFAIPGSLAHATLGHIDWPLAALIALGVVPGGYIGALIAARIKSRVLELLFGLFLVVIAVVLAAVSV